MIATERTIFDRIVNRESLAVTSTPVGESVTHRGVTLIALPERRVA